MTDTLSTSSILNDFPDRLTLRGLRVFIALENTKSVAEAAKNLGLSKSNVSQQITTMEQNLGTLLFDRKQKPISLTPAGQVLSLHAHRVVAMLLAAEASLGEFTVASLPVLNCAIIDDLDASLTPLMATSLQTQLPRSFINTFSGRSDHVTARLEAREADIAVTATIPTNTIKFQVQQLCREQFVLVTARGVYQPTNDWRSALRALPWVQYSEAMPMGQLVATHLKRLGFDAPRRFSFETSRSVIATVARTGGWTLATPLSILDASRFRGLVDIHPLPFANISRQIYLVNRINELGALPEVLAKQLRDFLQNELFPEFTKTASNISQSLDVFSETVI
ncbi:LysR family transcriptional regulator [Pacificibacter sp. AS14]|uniref:LysR family transcriptional regulator n=1 Tax=Pacificibacter sp. AS14 TaxID=3135785 RepID=UPI003172A725